MVEEAQPQTIEADDGFPILNNKFCGHAQEIMAIIQKNKPMAMTEFDENHVNSNIIARTINRYLGSECRKYTYQEVYDASKKVNLVYYPRDTDVNIFFLKENMKDAYILWDIQENGMLFPLNYGSGKTLYDVSNIVVGILLGYKKKDIRAWFVMGLQNEFKMKFSNLDQRAEFIQKHEFKKRRDEIAAEFETNYKKAIDRLNVIREYEEVPPEWESKLKTLEPPKPSLMKGMFGKKTAGRKLKRRKTIRKRITSRPS